MKLTRRVTVGIALSFLFVTLSYASTIPVFSKQSSDALFLGVEGASGLHGSANALSMFLNFQYYSTSSMMVGGSTSPLVSDSLSPVRISQYVVDVYGRNVIADNFVLYVGGHGNIDMIATYSDGVNDFVITPSDIKNALSVLPENMDKLVIIDACHSSSFIDDLKAISNITVFASTKYDDQDSYYGKDDGQLYFGNTISEFIYKEQSKLLFTGFDANDLIDYLNKWYWKPQYKDTMAKLADSGELVYMTRENFEYGFYQSPSYVTSTTVPEPSTMVLVCTSLAGLICAHRRRG